MSKTKVSEWKTKRIPIEQLVREARHRLSWDDEGFYEREVYKLSAEERALVIGWGDDYFAKEKIREARSRKRS